MTGFIGVGELKYVLTNLGEKMTAEEVDELLKAVDTSNGQVNYQGMLSRPYSTTTSSDATTNNFLLDATDLVRTILTN